MEQTTFHPSLPMMPSLFDPDESYNQRALPAQAIETFFPLDHIHHPPIASSSKSSFSNDSSDKMATMTTSSSSQQMAGVFAEQTDLAEPLPSPILRQTLQIRRRHSEPHELAALGLSSSSGSTSPHAGGTKARRTRPRRAPSKRVPACDACRSLKVKCLRENLEDASTACRRCAKMDLTCEIKDVLLKRGPPSREEQELLSGVGLSYSTFAQTIRKQKERRSILGQPLDSPPLAGRSRATTTSSVSSGASSSTSGFGIPSIRINTNIGTFSSALSSSESLTSTEFSPLTAYSSQFATSPAPPFPFNTAWTTPPSSGCNGTSLDVSFAERLTMNVPRDFSSSLSSSFGPHFDARHRKRRWSTLAFLDGTQSTSLPSAFTILPKSLDVPVPAPPVITVTEVNLVCGTTLRMMFPTQVITTRIPLGETIMHQRMPTEQERLWFDGAG